MNDEPSTPSAPSIASRLQPLVASARQAYIRLAAIVTVDSSDLRLLPGGHLAAYAAAVIVPALFIFFGLGMEALYSESIPFMLLALAFGLLTRTTGMLFIASYALLDLVMPPDVYSPSQVGRLIAYWPLALLVLTIPNAQRLAYLALAARGHRWLVRGGAAILSAAVVPPLVYLWTVITPYLIRPAFRGSPPVSAVAPLQQGGLLLAGLAFLAALAIALTYWRAAGVWIDFDPFQSGNGGRLTLPKRLVLYTVGIVALSGLVTSVLDVVLLFAGLLGGDLLVTFLARRTRLRTLLVKIPYPLRFVLALAGTFLIANMILSQFYQSFAGSEFFPLVLASAIGFLLFQLLLGAERLTGLGGTRSALLIALPTSLLLMAAFPGTAYADNCSGLYDCATGALACTAAGIAAMIAAIFNWILGVLKAIWNWITGVFVPLPPLSVNPASPEDAERGKEAVEGWCNAVKEMKARQVGIGTPEWQRIRNLTCAEYMKEFGND